MIAWTGLSLIIISLSLAEEDYSGLQEDDIVELLKTSLLQTDVKLEKQLKSTRLESTLVANQAESVVLFSAPLSLLVRTAVRTCRHAGFQCSFLTNLLSPSGRSDVESTIPLLLIFALGSLIFTVLAVQLLLVFVDNGQKEIEYYSNGLYPQSGQESLQAASLQTQQERTTIFGASESLPPRSNPSVSGSLGMPQTPSSNPFAMTTFTSQAADSKVTTPQRLSQQVTAHDALGPSLINPHGEANFWLHADAFHKLLEGHSPVEILGPSGKPLLNIRLASDESAVWVEVSTTPTSRFPHASVGPLVLGTVATPLMIRGPRNDIFASLVRGSDDSWQVNRGGFSKLTVNSTAAGIGLNAFSADGSLISTAIPIDGKAVQMKVAPGADSLLCLIVFLAVCLSTPDVTGLAHRL
jgi:hypothetical protein